jgi:hypothetical protein
VAQPTGACIASPEARAFAQALEQWLGNFGGLCAALRRGRDRGEDGLEDVAALLTVPALAVARASWNLWEELRRSEGADPDAELRLVMSDEQLRALRYALWGARPVPKTCARPGAARWLGP